MHIANPPGFPRRWTPRWLLLVPFALVVACGKGSGDAVTASSPTEILWDTWGVPHIYAPDDAQAIAAIEFERQVRNRLHVHNAALVADTRPRSRGKGTWSGCNRRL